MATEITNYFNMVPDQDNTLDLGKTSKRFRDVYVANNITDGTNTASVAEIVAGAGAESDPVFLASEAVNVGVDNVDFGAGNLETLGTITSDDITILEGNLLIDSTGSAASRVDRGATTNFASNVMATNGTDQWTLGMRNDSTNNFHFRDNINARTPLKITQSTGDVDFSADITLNGGEVNNLIVEEVSSLPSPAIEGRLVRLASDNRLYFGLNS